MSTRQLIASHVVWRRFSTFASFAACVALLCSTTTAVEILLNNRGVRLDEAQFDRMLTGGQTASAEAVATQVAVQINALSRICDLTPEQVEKLRLAGVGDFSRFEIRVARVKEKLVDQEHDPRELNNIMVELQPLQQEFRQGLLGEGSLFQKVLAGTLTDEQRTAYRAADIQRRAARYAATVHQYVAIIQRRTALTQAQRKSFIQLFAEKTPPPKRLGDPTVEMQYVMYQAAQLPAEDIREIFDPAQRRVLQAAFAQGAAHERFLRDQGFIPDEEEAADEAANEAEQASDRQ